MARNDYILSLAAANAHMTRYFCKELEDIMSVSYSVNIYCKSQKTIPLSLAICFSTVVF